MPAFKSTQVAYPIAAHIYLSLSMMMMSTFMVCDSINLNAQCNGTENRKLTKLTHTQKNTHTWFKVTQTTGVFSDICRTAKEHVSLIVVVRAFQSLGADLEKAQKSQVQSPTIFHLYFSLWGKHGRTHLTFWFWCSDWLNLPGTLHGLV